MSTLMQNYEANLDQEWLPLTDKHKAIKTQLENSVMEYMKTGKSKPVSIQGPYGSGKTQLMYHLFKYVWSNGGIGIYTHLEKLIPEKEVISTEKELASSAYAEYLKNIFKGEIESLKKGESRLMSGITKDYALKNASKINSPNVPVVVFIDELEQKYRNLDDRVKTDDHSPFKEALRGVERGDAGYCLILAFAPVSFYEFSKGEAQTGSFLPIILPLIEPKSFREYLGPYGNLAWWMGKGRCRGAVRTIDVFKANTKIENINKKELRDICANIGDIGNVPALNFESIESVSDFDKFRNYLIRMEPYKNGEELYAEGITVVKKCRICRSKHNLVSIIDKTLQSVKVPNTDISYYLSVILDGLSASDGCWPLFIDKEDWNELFNMVGDLILEFEGPNRLPTKELEKLQKDPDFIFNMRSIIQNIDTPGEGFCMSPGFIHTLFPFPISSPNLMDIDISLQRENLADQTYLAREDSNGLSVFFFLNSNKIKEFLIQESKGYLKENKVLMAVNLGDDDIKEIPKLANWLQKEGRFKVVTPRGILSDFLVSFLYWLKNVKAESLPIIGLLANLTENQAKAEKDKSRKLAYYHARIAEYLNVVRLKIPEIKYELPDTNLDVKIGFASEVMGFAYTSKIDWEAIYKFRQEFENTDFILSESKKGKGTGVPTALANLAVEDKKAISTSSNLRKIKDKFEPYLPDLGTVIDELSKDEFSEIPIEDQSKIIFEGIYLYLKDWKDPSKSGLVFNEEKNSWNNLKRRIDALSTKISGFEKSTLDNISLTHSLEKDKTRIINMYKLFDDYQNKISPYTKFLFTAIAEKSREIIENRLELIEKNFAALSFELEPELKKYSLNSKSVQNSSDELFIWINKSKDKIAEEFQTQFKDACSNLTKKAKLNVENIPNTSDFIESLTNISNDLQVLLDIDENLMACVTKANEISEKLKSGGKN